MDYSLIKSDVPLKHVENALYDRTLSNFWWYDIVLAEMFDQKCLTYIFSKKFNLNTLKCNVKQKINESQ